MICKNARQAPRTAIAKNLERVTPIDGLLGGKTLIKGRRLKFGKQPCLGRMH